MENKQTNKQNKTKQKSDLKNLVIDLENVTKFLKKKNLKPQPRPYKKKA